MDRRAFIIGAASATAVACSRATTSPQSGATPGKGVVATNDGVTLRYEEAGSGKTLVCIPGWSQTAAQFKHQLSGLSDRYRVIAVDMRGHGESDKPDNGYTIQRLAKDVQDLLAARNLTDVTLMGHSMGSSVIWSYWQLWGSDRLSKLIFVDQMPMITADPRWSPQEKEDAGAIFDPTSLYDTINLLAGPDGVKTTEGFIGGMFTKAYSRSEVSWVVQQNLKMPRQDAAALLYNHATQDWRRVIPRITLPTGGRGPGERRALEVAGVDPEAGPGVEDRDLRGERGGKSLHVHGESGQVQSDRPGLHRLIPQVETADSGLVTSLKTAKALGLTIPPSLLARADQVIE